MNELKPCPFCGSPGRWRQGGNTESGVVECSSSKCLATVFPYLDRKEIAYARWNTRPTVTDEEIDAAAESSQSGESEQWAFKSGVSWLRERIGK